MDREALDFRRSAAPATSNTDQVGESRTLSASSGMAARVMPSRDRLYPRDRNDAQPTAPRDNRLQDRNIQTVTIQSILKGAREAIIDFDGAAYRLRITRNHRLILTK